MVNYLVKILSFNLMDCQSEKDMYMEFLGPKAKSDMDEWPDGAVEDQNGTEKLEEKTKRENTRW